MVVKAAELGIQSGSIHALAMAYQEISSQMSLLNDDKSLQKKMNLENLLKNVVEPVVGKTFYFGKNQL